jgi:hypothetical protein
MLNSEEKKSLKMQFFTSSAKRAGQCHLSSGKIEPVSDYSMKKRSNSVFFGIFIPQVCLDFTQ